MTDPTDETTALSAPFELERPLLVGAEEELMVLDAESLDLAPRACELQAAARGARQEGSQHREGGADDRHRGRAELKLELPASQLEIAAPPAERIDQLTRSLHAGRHRLAAAADRLGVRLASAGAHPFTPAEGVLNGGERYREIERRFGSVARRQLVSGLHVHVSVGGADRALAVYNALREHLPDLAALGANAPFHLGCDSGLASVRPSISGLLPRQGVPPAFRSWEELASEIEWGLRSGRMAGASEWWWELRIHPRLGTIEVRVPDAQATLGDTAALIAVAAALVLRLAELHDAEELPPPVPSWRIVENRFSAMRHGVHGEMTDVRSGAAEATSERLQRLLTELEPFAARLGARRELSYAKQLAVRNGADRQREIATEAGARALAAHLCELFLAE